MPMMVHEFQRLTRAFDLRCVNIATGWVIVMTGVYRIPLIAMLDRELTCQTGSDLRAWADEHGLPFVTVVETLQGRWTAASREELLCELATTLGISMTSLKSWCRENQSESPAA